MNFRTNPDNSRYLEIGNIKIPCKALRAVFDVADSNIQRIKLVHAFTGCGLIAAKNAVLLWETVREEAKRIGY